MAERPRRRAIHAAVALVVVAVVVTLLVVPHPVDGALVWLEVHLPDSRDPAATRWGVYWTLEDGANALLFVPIGYALTRWTRRWWLGLTLGVAISAACETAQIFIPERQASLIDVASNALGTTIGVLLAVALASRRPRRAA